MACRHSSSVVYIVHADATSGRFLERVEAGVRAVVFSSFEVADRVILSDPSKKVVIEHSIDGRIYRTGDGGAGNILSVGNLIGHRQDKWPSRLIEVDRCRPVSLLGAGNNGLRCAIGAADNYSDYVARLGRYKVYLNPSDIISMAMLEAMASGLPAVTFEPINFKDLVVSGQNGFVVRSIQEAVDRLGLVTSDEGLRIRMGRLARAAVTLRFSPDGFQARWNALLSRVSL